MRIVANVEPAGLTQREVHAERVRAQHRNPSLHEVVDSAQNHRDAAPAKAQHLPVENAQELEDRAVGICAREDRARTEMSSRDNGRSSAPKAGNAKPAGELRAGQHQQPVASGGLQEHGATAGREKPRQFRSGGHQIDVMQDIAADHDYKGLAGQPEILERRDTKLTRRPWPKGADPLSGDGDDPGRKAAARRRSRPPLHRRTRAPVRGGGRRARRHPDTALPLRGRNTVNVLYVNHTSRISGGERSLLDLLTALPDDVVPAVACPRGPLADAVRDRGVAWHRLPSVEASLRLHPLHTMRGLAALGVAAVVVRRAAARLDADLVHANSARAGLVAALAARCGAPTAIAHVRDCLPAGAASSAALHALAIGSSTILANSDYTRASVERVVGTSRARLRVVHSPVDVDRFDPSRYNRAAARAALGLADAPVLAVVAQLTPWKGQDDAVRIVARLKRTHPGVRLLLIGAATFTGRATRHDNRDYVRRLHTLIDDQDVRGEVVLLGERPDVPAVLRSVDVLLVPSWEEPFGRAVIEGMAMGIPVVATNVGGPIEILRPQLDGLLLAPCQPERWADEISALLDDPQRRSNMGSSARRRALERFSLSAHVDAVLAAYSEALEGRGR